MAIRTSSSCRRRAALPSSSGTARAHAKIIAIANYCSTPIRRTASDGASQDSGSSTSPPPICQSCALTAAPTTSSSRPVALASFVMSVSPIRRCATRRLDPAVGPHQHSHALATWTHAEAVLLLLTEVLPAAIKPAAVVSCATATRTASSASAPRHPMVLPGHMLPTSRGRRPTNGILIRTPFAMR